MAVVLKHAAIFPDNEQAVGRVARELGFTQVRRGVQPCLCRPAAFHAATSDVWMRR